MKEQNDNKLRIEADPEPADYARLQKLTDKIVQFGYDPKTAARFAVLIDENPVLDADGAISVIEGDKVLAKLKLDVPLKD